MPDSHPNGADVLLQQLESQGVDCVFASPIAVMAPIWEALARRGNDLNLSYFRCRHELLAVGLASGYYKATGRPDHLPADVDRCAERITRPAHRAAGAHRS